MGNLGKEKGVSEMKFGIAVDSACDLRELGEWSRSDIVFHQVPLKLEIGEKEFVDDKNLNLEEFMKELSAYKGKTGSAAPSPGEWAEAFEAADITFAFTISGNLSGSYSSAEVAKEMVLERHPEKKIYVMNSFSAGPEETMLARKAIECIAAGMEFDAIVEAIENYRVKTTRLLFILEHMDNLVNNGRVSKLAGSLAGLLGIRILGRASDEGTLDLLHKLRGKFTVYNKCAEEMFERGFKGGRVVISHCLNQEKADYLRNKILEKYPQSEVIIMPTCGLCGYYAERNGMLIGYEVEE